MSLKLDDTDVRMIEMLQENGRVMYKDIAKSVGVSLPTVKARIDRLVQLGVIKKFTVIVDPDRIYGMVRGFLLLQINPQNMEDAVEKLSALKEVKEVYLTAGSSPLVLKVETGDLEKLGNLVSKKLSAIGGVTSCSCLVITKTRKEEYGASLESDSMVQFKCSFCGAPVVGKPYVEYIDGGRYYFNSARCAKAYRDARGRQEKVGGTV